MAYYQQFLEIMLSKIMLSTSGQLFGIFSNFGINWLRAQEIL